MNYLVITSRNDLSLFAGPRSHGGAGVGQGARGREPKESAHAHTCAPTGPGVGVGVVFLRVSSRARRCGRRGLVVSPEVPLIKGNPYGLP